MTHMIAREDILKKTKTAVRIMKHRPRHRKTQIQTETKAMVLMLGPYSRIQKCAKASRKHIASVLTGPMPSAKGKCHIVRNTEGQKTVQLLKLSAT